MLKLRKNKKGFTLVELIVVIAIMAVLAGVVAGVTVSTLNKNTNKTAFGEIATLATALNAYLSDADVNPDQTDTTKADSFKAVVTSWITSYNGEYPGTLTDDATAPRAGSHQFKYEWNDAGTQITFSFTPKGNYNKTSRTYEYNDQTSGVREVTAAANEGGEDAETPES